MTERQLVAQVARYMQVNYPRVVYRFDLAADLKLTTTQTYRHKALHPHRGYPDLFIAVSRVYPSRREDGEQVIAAGLFLELKREGTRLRTRTGKWANAHIAEQAEVLEQLIQAGYIAQFAVGFDEARAAIDSYLVFPQFPSEDDGVPF